MEKSVFRFIMVAMLSSMWIERGYSTYTAQSYEYNLNKKWDAGSHNYSDALSKAILFFEGQRSGKLPADQRMTWRRDSALSDGSADNVDLAGGYYDAGDNVKFGFPMAFTATMLSWSVLEFGGLMGGELGNAKTAIRWATDYLLKATAHPGTIYVQVGDPNNDHKCWERPEDMDTARTVYKIDAQHPGSDVAAETAAALAAASLVFRKSDPSYTTILVQTAVKAFDFADQHRGAYSDSLQSSVCPFYCSYSGYQDELLWGAIWLHKATRDPKYLNFVQANGQNLGAYGSINSFGWDNKHIGTRVLASKEFLLRKAESLKEYKGLADNYMCSLLPGSGSQYTPGGLLYVLPGSNLQYVTSASFILLTYAKYLKSSKQVVYCGQNIVTPTKLRAMAKRQVEYILGDNPGGMSYMVGYGSKYPQRIHHRGSSLPSVGEHPEAMGCEAGFQYLSTSGSNPNMLVGAVVGGPDNNDGFSDDRNSYAQAEPTTYINAPFVGSLAYLAHSTRS